MLLQALVATHLLWWTHPNRLVDGTPIVLDDIEGTRIEWSSTRDFARIDGQFMVWGKATSIELPDPPRTRCYRGYTWVRTAKYGYRDDGLVSEPWCKIVGPAPVENLRPFP